MPITPLAIPNPLTTDYVAPQGTWAPPASPVNVIGTVNADLSRAVILGAGKGYLFKPGPGARLTTQLNHVENMVGIGLGQVGPNARAAMTIQGGQLIDVRAGIFYKSADGGRLDGALDSVTASGMGVGIRTFGSVELVLSRLFGGGLPPSGNPGGGIALDLNDTGTVVADQIMYARDNTISGFKSDGFQGDGLIAENTVAWAQILANQIGDVSDAGADIKAALAYVLGNLFLGTFGSRILAVHTGHTYSGRNLFQIPTGGATPTYGLHSTSGYGADPTHPDKPGLVSDSDTFALADSDNGKIARAAVACTGSLNFPGPSAGCILLRNATWNGPQATPWITPKSACNGVDYFPSVIAE